MADVGNFDTITTAEIKDVYPTGTFDRMYRTTAKYRAKLRKDSSFAQDAEGVVKYPLKLNGMWSVGIIADNAAFPTPKDPVNLKASMTPEIFANAIQVGLKTKMAAKSQKSTWNGGGILADRIETAAEEGAAFLNKVYAGSCRGRLATVESDGSSTFVAAKGTLSPGIELLEEGMLLEAYTAFTSGSVRDSFSAHKITAIDRDTRTVTYTNSAGSTDDRTLVAGDHIFISGSYARSPVSLNDIVDDGTVASTFGGHSRTTYPKLKGIVLGNGGTLRNLSEQIMLDACTRQRKRTRKRVTRILSNDGQWRKYLEFVAPDRRFAGGTTSAQRTTVGGDEDSAALAAFDANAKIEVDDDICPRSMYFLAWDTFFLYEAMPLDWIEDESLLRLIPTDGGNKAGFLAYMGSVENQGNLMPIANVRVDDLKDPLFGDS